MSAAAIALALGAAAVHAAWNLLLADAEDTAPATAAALLLGAALWLPVAAVLIALDGVGTEALPYVAISIAFEIAYLAALAAAYERAELSVVYPVARGLGPVFVLLAGVVALGDDVRAVQAAGILLVALGVLALRSGSEAPSSRGVAWGVFIALTIAGYTLSDDRGVEHAPPLAYVELTVGPAALVYAAAIARTRGPAAIRAALGVRAALGGLGMFGGYALVLAALALAPAAPVAALRETGVLMAVAAAGLLLGEPVGRRRLAAAAVVVAGIALVTLG